MITPIFASIANENFQEMIIYKDIIKHVKNIKNIYIQYKIKICMKK